MGKLCWHSKTLFWCICSYRQRSCKCCYFTNTCWDKLLPRQMFWFLDVVAISAGKTTGSEAWILASRKHFEAVSFIALHLEFLSFLLMIPSSISETTIDFIDDITNRVSIFNLSGPKRKPWAKIINSVQYWILGLWSNRLYYDFRWILGYWIQIH